MNKSLRFSHKILLAVSLIVMLAFTLFTLYNDYLQRNATRTSLENYLAEMGESTSTNIRNLLEGRINLVTNLAQNIAREPANAETLMDESVLTSSFLTDYLGKVDGSFSIRPDTKMPDGYDPRSRAWYKDGMNASGAILTEPYIDLATNKMVIGVISTVRSSWRRAASSPPARPGQPRSSASPVRVAYPGRRCRPVPATAPPSRRPA